MDQTPETRWYSMDLPNLIKTLLSLHTQQFSLENFVDVTWKEELADKSFWQSKQSSRALPDR